MKYKSKLLEIANNVLCKEMCELFSKLNFSIANDGFPNTYYKLKKGRSIFFISIL